MKGNAVAYIAIMIAMSVWASSFLLTQEALRSFEPITVVTIRMTLATVLLGLFGLITRKLQMLKKEHVAMFLLGGFLQPFCYFICEAYGLTKVDATTASVVLSTIPLFAPFFAFLILRERVTVLNIVGILVSLVGVLFIVVEKQEFVVDMLGILLLLGSVFTAVLYSINLRRIPGEYTNVSIVFYIHASSLLFFIPTFLIVDVDKLGLHPVLWSSVISIIVLAVFASVMSYILFCMAVRRIGVTRANAFCNVMPAITALVVWAVYGTQLNTMKWIGVAVVIIGLFISQITIDNRKTLNLK